MGQPLLSQFLPQENKSLVLPDLLIQLEKPEILIFGSSFPVFKCWQLAKQQQQQSMQIQQIMPSGQNQSTACLWVTSWCTCQTVNLRSRGRLHRCDCISEVSFLSAVSRNHLAPNSFFQTQYSIVAVRNRGCYWSHVQLLHSDCKCTNNI